MRWPLITFFQCTYGCIGKEDGANLHSRRRFNARLSHVLTVPDYLRLTRINRVGPG